MHATDRFSSLAARCAGVLASLLLAGLACLAQAPSAERVTVSDVIILGNKLVPADEIRSQLKTRPGLEYSPEQVQEDVRTLYKTRKFGNVYAQKQDDGPNKVKVQFFVRDYPSVVEKVEYRGAKHLSTEKLDEVTSIRKGSPCNPLVNKAACGRIEARYHEEGRPYTSCTLLKGGEPGDTEVIFNIVEGPKVKVKGIHFTGNTFVSGPVLKTHINSSAGLLGFGIIGSPYVPAMVEADIADLVKYYRSFGFHDVKVSRSVQHSPDCSGVTITYHIQEGVRYRVKDRPTIHGVKSPEMLAKLEALSAVKPMSFYDERAITADLTVIKNHFGYQGCDARAQAIPVYANDAPGLVTVHYEVEESQPARVGQIFIVGNERTRQNVILRQIPLYPGQILTYPDLRLAERNLARLGIFQNTPDGAVKPKLEVLDNPNDPSSPYKDILVTVQEDNTGSLLFGVGVNSDSGLTGSIVLNERNFDLFRPPTSFDDFLNGTAFRGAGQEFRIEAVPGTQLQRYTVSLREPFLFDSPWSLTTSGYFYQRYFNEYQEDRLGGRFTLGRKLSDYWSVSGTMRIENVNVSGVSEFAPPDYQNALGNNFLLGFRAGVTRDSRDSYLRPTSGGIIDLSYEEVTGTHTFPLVNLDASRYFTVYQRNDGTGKHVVALHSQVGWAGDNTPVYERFFAGGFRSIRGFQFRGVGPDINGFKVGGDFMVLNSIEYQIPVKATDSIYFVTFVDSGTVTPRIDKWDDYRVSAGFGIRFVVPMLGPVPIALDFGFPIVKGPFDNEQVFNFWMGFFR
jgi:outer membrane protein assembly complex protein YaeT